MPEPMNREIPVRIVGGGMTGLTLALKLARRGISVVVHERDPYLGGLTAESKLAGIPVERFYHCVLPTDTRLLSLFDEIGLSDAVGWTRTRTGFFTGEALLEMTTTADFLRFPALTFPDRLRLAWTISYCAMLPNWKRLDHEPISSFLKRHGGARLFETIWEPLLLAKLGKQYDRFSATFIWATVYRMLQARKAKGRSERLGFVKGRYGRVFQALRSALEAAGGQVESGKAVTGLRRDARGQWSLLVDGAEKPAKGIALCVPAPIAADWINSLVPAYAKALDQVEYLGVVCEVLLLKRSLTPYYVLNLTDRRLPFTGVIETSNLTGIEEYQGRHLVYVPRYAAQDSPIWNCSDDAIHAETVEHMKRIVPDFDTADVVAWTVNRARYVQPIHPPGWGSRIPPTILAPGLAYVSTAQIHPWTVFNDEAVGNVDSRFPDVLSAFKLLT